ncbi:MAG: hypothetical protein ACLP59_18110 [Bryobacteraceae bacterium]
MTPFMEKFPDLGRRETKSILVPPGQVLPAGEYGYIEFYCDESGCDCRRVTICVLRPDTGWGEIWATISYGWESPDFYKEWSAASDPLEMQRPCLDPLNPQTVYSNILLDLFREILQSPDYVERLKRHYRMFRDSLELEKWAGRRSPEVHRFENKPRRLRDPKRRSRYAR